MSKRIKSTITNQIKRKRVERARLAEVVIELKNRDQGEKRKKFGSEEFQKFGIQKIVC